MSSGPRTDLQHRELVRKAWTPSVGRLHSLCMLAWMESDNIVMNEVLRKKANAAFPKAKEKQAWAVQPSQDRGFLS